MNALVLNKKHRPSVVARWLAEVDVDVTLVSDRSAYPDDVITQRPRRFKSLTVERYAGSSWLPGMCQELGIDRIASVAEGDVLRAAYTRELLELHGQGVASALAYRDKYVMKSIAHANGVAIPAMRLVDRVSDVLAFAGAHGFPVVVKPRDAGASIGVCVLHSEADVRARAEGDPAWPAGQLAERLMTGRLYHVDGLMQLGRVLHAAASVYGHPVPTYGAIAVPRTSAMLATDSATSEALRRAVGEVVGALPPAPDVTAFHAELFLEEGQTAPVLCEIACRPGGAGVVDVYEAAFGVNLFQATLRGQLGAPSSPLPRDVPAGRFGWAWFPPQDATLERLPSPASLPGRVSCHIAGQLGKRYRNGRVPMEQLGNMVFSLSSADPLEALQCVTEWWDAGVQWRMDCDPPPFPS